jgi:hypothetical protein
MRLTKVLDLSNFQEKTSFYKLFDTLLNNSNKADEIQIEFNKIQMKELESEKIEKLFDIVHEDYERYLKNEIYSSLNQVDILLDILIRDGNSILDLKWFHELYKRELDSLIKETEAFKSELESDIKDQDEYRRRDYLIYRSCVETAFFNDQKNNLNNKVTPDEFSILKTLSESLSLSNQEIRLIHCMVVPFNIMDENSLLKIIKDLGIGIYSKKTNKVYVADEIIKVLRRIRNKQIADKYFRRILNSFKEKEINSICKKHNILFKGVELTSKIKSIINQGISLKTIFTQDVLTDGIPVNDKKKELNLIMQNLGVEPKGTTLEDKAELIIKHFNSIEKDEKLGLAIDGYIKLCSDLDASELGINEIVNSHFEFIDERNSVKILNPELLLDHNIKPKDILELLSKEKLKDFCVFMNFKTRGDLIDVILDSYTDSQNVYIENYSNLGNRDLLSLKANGINISVDEVGLKYEEITKRLLLDLGFHIDENLRKSINTAKDKIDILINNGNKEVILVECKTAKSTKFNKFSQCSRQMKSYHKLLSEQGYRVIKSLLIAPDFTQDFIDECEIEIDLNLSLISSEVLINIWNGFKKAQQSVFPVNLLMRDALISDEKILKALKVK